MQKKQKIKSKKQSQRSFRAFISIVNWYKNKFDVVLYISNIYESNYPKKEISVHRLPLWRDISDIYQPDKSNIRDCTYRQRMNRSYQKQSKRSQDIGDVCIKNGR